MRALEKTIRRVMPTRSDCFCATLFVAAVGAWLLQKNRSLILQREQSRSDTEWWRSRYYWMKTKYEQRTTWYWRNREDASLYSNNGTVFRTVRELAPHAQTILDVGAHEGSFILQFDWIPTKVATDMRFDETPEQTRATRNTRGVVFLPGDFLKMDFGPTVFDVVICNQVVEHLPNRLLQRFVRKMKHSARLLVVSTTLDLPRGAIESHVQDPISEARFRGWFETPAPRAPGRIVRYVAEQGTHLQWDDEAVDFTRRRMVPVRRNVTVGGDAHIPVRNQIVAWMRDP